jgi:hypothetical protein
VTTRLPDNSTVFGLPPQFPLGISTLTWTATDSCGNYSTVVSHVLVQFTGVVVPMRLAGYAPFPSLRNVRISCAGWSRTYPVVLSSESDANVYIQIPGDHQYECFEAKDLQHSITVLGTTSAMYGIADPVVLRQGDSNNDDKVDILDFGIFVNDYGFADPSGRSNFNGDDQVNAADFGFIASEFLSVGESCAGLATLPPRSRISIKQLTLLGMPELAVADLNGDGWVDTTDMSLYLQGIRSNPAGDPADSRPVASGD